MTEPTMPPQNFGEMMEWREASDTHRADVFLPHGWPERLLLPTALLEGSLLFIRDHENPYHWNVTALNGKAQYVEESTDPNYTQLRLTNCEWRLETPE
jgi:hypothetical protein